MENEKLFLSPKLKEEEIQSLIHNIQPDVLDMILRMLFFNIENVTEYKFDNNF